MLVCDERMLESGYAMPQWRIMPLMISVVFVGTVIILFMIRL
jgi:hypothetical protein